jgi:predicted ribosomally synthesized peptide with SipW-like signal peptide
MKNKKKIATTFIIILIVLVIVGGVFAYLTSTDTKTNIFTLGRVKIELTEPNFVQDNAIELRPGDEIAKDPKITNIGKNSAYVYIKVLNPIVNLSSGEGSLFSYTINSGWTQLDEVEQCGYKATTYYYNTALSPNASTPTLFNTVSLNNYSNDSDPNQELIINGYAIQSSYLASGSTIRSIFTSTFQTDLSDTTEECNSATDCSNNVEYTTIPGSLKGLAKIMAKNAYLDNGRSECVSSCSGVDFSKISSDTNGKGIYEIASTKNDTYPIYYYRGEVDNNNVKFAGFCWKAVRTTDTGGVKMIYNGEPDSDGNCTRTSTDSTNIGRDSFSLAKNSLGYIGYMNGTIYNESSESDYNLTGTVYVYGKDVSYSNGTYTLTSTTTNTSGRWSDNYNSVNGYHYTCLSTGTTCTSVYYIWGLYSSGISFITLTNGKKVEDALDDMLSNKTDSVAKTTIENWYNTNLSSYTNYIEDTIYCNDRSISNLGGWDSDGENNGKLYFNSSNRVTTFIPTLECSRVIDRFTVSSSIGNGKLTYPVGLLTADEVMYAGGQLKTNNDKYYLYDSGEYWTITPYSSDIYRFVVYNYGSFRGRLAYNNYQNGAEIITANYRPVISLKSTNVVSSGDGTSNNPYNILIDD